MMQPYNMLSLPDDSPDNAMNRAFRINNLLASVNSIETIDTTELQKLTDISDPAMPAMLLELYIRYFKWCLIDKKLSKEELSQLKQLKKLFLLSDKEVREYSDKIISEIYLQAVDEVLEDGIVTNEEKDFLRNLRDDLYLDDTIAAGILKQASENYLKNYLEEALADERLSPDEEEQLFRLSENLNIGIKTDKYTRDLLERYKIYWLIDNGELPVVPVDINLDDNEACHFYLDNARWYEAEGADPAEPWNRVTMRRKLNAAIASQFSGLDFMERKIEDYSLSDAGKIYFTNKRIYFAGNANFIFFDYENIKDYNIFRNGFEINLNSGTRYMFQIDESPDITCLLLNRLLAG
ncbi:MAG: hypothetical protein HUU54_03880 [Ignavibacteriaceae bacterium]|nr:hypothetical protein [Ignavibacteriaceae bacterium]